MKKIGLVLFTLLMVILFQFPAYAAKPDHAKGGKPNSGDPQSPVKSVCIDPGHGGSDPGAVAGGIKESNLNLDVAVALEPELQLAGYQTFMTRTDDSTKSNNDRYTYCNSVNAGILVSIHHNASTNPEVNYTLGLYHGSNSLANIVSGEVASEFGLSFSTQRYPSGVLIKSDMPSMISESYFMTNTLMQEQLQFVYDAMVDKEARALLAGIKQYYQPL